MPMMTQEETQMALLNTQLEFQQATTPEEITGAAIKIIRAATHALDPDSLRATVESGEHRSAFGCFFERPHDWMDWSGSWPKQRAMLSAILNLHHAETELREELKPRKITDGK